MIDSIPKELTLGCIKQRTPVRKSRGREKDQCIRIHTTLPEGWSSVPGAHYWQLVPAYNSSSK